MAYRYDSVHRLEPAHPYADLARGLAAEVADPAWFLGRQWQLGEHRGEDAASPVKVAYRASQAPIRTGSAHPDADPQAVPAEAVIEAEPDDFWTVGRRISIGRAVERAASDAGRPLPDDGRRRLADLPIPYDLFNGTGFDGQALFRDRAGLGLPDEWFPQRPPRPAPRDRWNSVELAYDADFTAGGTALTLRRHDGGALDWWSVDAAGPVAVPDPLPREATVHATRMQYPGAPNPRWWQIEQTRNDLGAYAPDRGHFATLLLAELVSSHSDDWFTFPVVAQAGRVVTLHAVDVIDSFGQRWPVAPPDDGWTLFAVTGLDQRSLVLWHTAATALVGPPVDQVDFGVDEDANVVWAVERRVGGRDLPTPPPSAPVAAPVAASVATGQPTYAYRPGAETPRHWHPYVVDEDTPGQPRRLAQARLADLADDRGRPMPLPITNLLRPNRAVDDSPVHHLEPATVPVDGLQLERRYLLCRRTDGLPVLWKQRRRVALETPPTMRLQHDVLDPE